MTHIPAALRREVIARAGGCCEYCLLSQQDRLFSFEIDHIIAERHRGETVLDNLCLSCPQCNRLKSSDICSLDPETNAITPLFHPRRDAWLEHFVLNGVMIEPLTPEGRVTAYLFEFNHCERI